MSIHRAVALGALFIGLWACQPEPAPVQRGCGAAGGTQACICADGAPGAQTCEPDGAWGACSCRAAPDPEPEPIDCQTSPWSDWSPCSAACGDGRQTRTRTIEVEPAHGGLACGATEEQRACVAGDCPVDCALGPWSDWDPCSAACGGGVQYRSREVQTEPANGGAACGEMVEEQACNTHGCPVDCRLGAWSAWGACSAECDGGQQRRTRAVEVQPAHGGAACGATEEARACNEIACYRARYAPIRLAADRRFGLTPLEQRIADGTQIVLHEGFNHFIMLDDGSIVLEDNPRLGLTVLGQNYANETDVILHEGYNQWFVDGDGHIRLADAPEFGLTVRWQEIRNGTRIVIHRGHDGWSW